MSGKNWPLCAYCGVRFEPRAFKGIGRTASGLEGATRSPHPITSPDSRSRAVVLKPALPRSDDSGGAQRLDLRVGECGVLFEHRLGVLTQAGRLVVRLLSVRPDRRGELF